MEKRYCVRCLLMDCQKIRVPFIKEECPKCGYREAVWESDFDDFICTVWKNMGKLFQPAEKSSVVCPMCNKWDEVEELELYHWHRCDRCDIMIGVK